MNSSNGAYYPFDGAQQRHYWQTVPNAAAATAAAAVPGIAGLYYNDPSNRDGDFVEGGQYSYDANNDDGRDDNDGDDCASEGEGEDEEVDEEELAFANHGLKPRNKQHQEYLQLWETRYAELAEHKRQFGTCLVKKEENAKLFNWMRKQQAQHRQGKLSRERHERLTQLDFPWLVGNSQNAKIRGISKKDYFEKRCQELLEYKEKNGHCNVGYNGKEDRSLRQWLSGQRDLLQKGRLKKQRYDRIIEIGYDFHADSSHVKSMDERWSKMHDLLVQYKNTHGNGNVPADWPENPPLSQWVRRQRERHREKKLSAERVEKLKAIDPDIFKTAIGWEHKFQELVEYKEKNGECTIPFKFEASKSLKEWASKQKKGYGDGALSMERAVRLRKLGFDFLPSVRGEYKFETKFKLLQQFKAEHGHVNVPHEYDKNVALARWVEMQREKHKQDRIMLKHYTALEDIGLDWEIRQPNPEPEMEPEEEGNGEEDEQKEQGRDQKPTFRARIDTGKLTKQQKKNIEVWERYYSQLDEYRRTHGTCVVPERLDLRLQCWTQKQRGIYHRSEMTRERYDRLRLLGFDFSWQRPDLKGNTLGKRFDEKQWEIRCNQLREHKRIHGHCNVKLYRAAEKKKLPPELKASAGLGDWIVGINQQVKRGQFTDQKRLAELKSIGWEPFVGIGSRKDDKRWHENYRRLEAYCQQHGSSDVPTTYPEDQTLADWTAAQRTRHKLGKLEQSRIDKLNLLGFSFASFERERLRKANWEKRYRELEKHKAEHGHCKVTQSKGGRKLHEFCANQRTRYLSKQMTSEEEALLRLIGFELPDAPSSRMATGTHKETWLLRYNELVEYKKKHGNTRVPTKSTEYATLSRWVQAQRKKTRLLLPEECVTKLDAIDFEWRVHKNSTRRFAEQHTAKSPPETSQDTNKKTPSESAADPAAGGIDPEEAEWQSFFDQLKNYMKNPQIKYVGHQPWHMDIMKLENKALAQWAQRQRYMKRTGTITKTRHDQLTELGFFPCDQQRKTTFSSLKPQQKDASARANDGNPSQAKNGPRTLETVDI